MRGMILKTCQEAEPIEQSSASVSALDFVLQYLQLLICCTEARVIEDVLGFRFLHVYALKSDSPHRTSDPFLFYLAPFKVHVLSVH